MKNRIALLLALWLALTGCSTKWVRHCEIEDNKHVGACEQIVNDAYLYALLSVNSYEAEENTPFRLPAAIREVRHADSQVSEPSTEYVHTKVYDNGSFQAKVFEIACVDSEVCGDRPAEIVIAYRGTTNFVGRDMIQGTFTHDHRNKAIRLYEEIKAKYAGENVEIFLTGHSLGGALALEVAYTYSEDYVHVYVFNTSYHVTAWKKFKTLPRSERVVSIEEIGDSVVGPARLLWRTPEGLHIYKFDYVNTLILGNHSRYNIALGLLKEAKENGVAEAVRIYDRNQTLYE